MLLISEYCILKRLKDSKNHSGPSRSWSCMSHFSFSAQVGFKIGRHMIKRAVPLMLLILQPAALDDLRPGLFQFFGDPLDDSVAEFGIDDIGAVAEGTV